MVDIADEGGRKMRFYKCQTCGQMVMKIKNTGASLICCGKPMLEIEPMTSKDEMMNEKHIPEYAYLNNVLRVWVGEIPHPMTDEHYIEWILVETNKGYHMKKLKVDRSAEATFKLEEDEKPLAIYTYCNIHSLWELDLCK